MLQVFSYHVHILSDKKVSRSRVQQFCQVIRSSQKHLVRYNMRILCEPFINTFFWSCIYSVWLLQHIE